MNGWIKYFGTGLKVETGFDNDIARGVSSWSKGRLDNITKVQLIHNGRSGILCVSNTKWHQFDRFEVQVMIGKHVPTVSHRVVQALIGEHHLDRYLIEFPEEIRPRQWYLERTPERFGIHKPIEITEDLVGKWATMVLTPGEFPYVVFADKGKFS